MTLLPVLSAVFQEPVDIDYWNLGFTGKTLSHPTSWSPPNPHSSAGKFICAPPPLSYRSEEGERIGPVDELYPLCHMIAWNIPRGPRRCCNEGSDGM